MSKATILRKFRECLLRGDFTMKAVSDASGIKYTTLAEMKKPEYSASLEEKLGRLDALDEAIRKLQAGHEIAQ